MKKTHWKYRLLIWIGKHVVKVPIVVNFTPDWMDDVYAVGFAWSPQAADRMRGDDMLAEKLKNAQAAQNVALGSRKARRVVNAAAKRAAKKEAGRG